LLFRTEKFYAGRRFDTKYPSCCVHIWRITLFEQKFFLQQVDTILVLHSTWAQCLVIERSLRSHGELFCSKVIFKFQKLIVRWGKNKEMLGFADTEWSAQID
jgi:hypothetical protein